MKTSLLTDDDWFFYKVLPSKHCPIKDVRVLKEEYSLPEFLKLADYVEMMDDIDRANEKDTPKEK